MKRIMRLTVVFELAKTEEDKAARRFELAMAKRSAEQQKLDELSSYYAEYEQNLQPGTTPMRAQSLASDRRFLSNLSQAISAQQAQIDIAQRYVDTAKSAWLKAQLKRSNLQSFVDRRKREVQLEEEKREQKRIDDWVNGRFR